jgi:hypothetical protein
MAEELFFDRALLGLVDGDFVPLVLFFWSRRGLTILSRHDYRDVAVHGLERLLPRFRLGLALDDRYRLQRHCDCGTRMGELARVERGERVGRHVDAGGRAQIQAGIDHPGRHPAFQRQLGAFRAPQHHAGFDPGFDDGGLGGGVAARATFDQRARDDLFLSATVGEAHFLAHSLGFTVGENALRSLTLDAHLLEALYDLAALDTPLGGQLMNALTCHFSSSPNPGVLFLKTLSVTRKLGLMLGHCAEPLDQGLSRRTIDVVAQGPAHQASLHQSGRALPCRVHVGAASGVCAYDRH